MSKARVAVLHVVSGQLTVTVAAKTYGFSRQHLHRLLKRYREGGLQAVDARSRRPASNPRAVSDEVIAALVRLREDLVAQGLDAGPLTLQWHLHDDHSRYLLTATAYRRVGGPDVVASFIDTANTYVLPAATLTDNGAVYTARFTHGHNEFELLLATLGIIQKNGHPGHPQTQGKIERFHQTLKHWLSPRPRPTDLADLHNYWRNQQKRSGRWPGRSVVPPSGGQIDTPNGG
jgi:transposase InsO family protein